MNDFTYTGIKKNERYDTFAVLKLNCVIVKKTFQHLHNIVQSVTLVQYIR